ncbi:MAG: Mrp/NBP35 family ATP-binding protein [Clostridia bacterium]|nr:Mrp/NBP35 family ATP-binding protein [Clostridia bacterium]
MSTCSGNCESCSSTCERKDMIEKTNEFSNVKHVIGVVSGKGCVGKSLVTGLLASKFARLGYKTAVLDADITGPSVPKMFGLNTMASGDGQYINPAVTASGIKVMSVNLLLEDRESPVIWRGPMIAGVVKQFWTEVNWGDIDIMFIDMPPGTGDVPLTIFQSIPVMGIVMVTTPQDLVSLIVKKANNMANMMNIPVLGLVENMSYAVCPDCGKKINIFGEGKTAQAAVEMHLPLLAQIPLDAKLSALCDEGEIERFSMDYVDAAVEDLRGKYIK